MIGGKEEEGSSSRSTTVAIDAKLSLALYQTRLQSYQSFIAQLYEAPARLNGLSATRAPSVGQVHTFGVVARRMEDPLYRSVLALHVAQADIPIGSSSSTSSGSKYLSVPSLANAQEVGQPIYSPPNPTSPTPLQRLYAQHCHEESEFDCLCAPLSNGSWKQRWERMCVASDGRGSNALASSSRSRMLDSSGQLMLDANGDHDLGNASPEEEAQRAREAELWRKAGCFKRVEVNVTRSDETQALLALASDWLELDSEVEGIRFDSELALKQEVAYACHLHVQNLILPIPRNPWNVVDYARALANLLSVPGYITYSIRMPISDPSEAHSAKTWETWNTIRQICAYNARLSVCLDLSTPLPNAAISSRWHAEPVRSVFLPASTYLANAKGYPVLSKNCQALMKGLFKFKPTIILSDIYKGLHSSGGPDAYTS